MNPPIPANDVPHDTGLRCLVALLRHHRVQVSEEELVRRFALERKELDDSLILRIAGDLGCRARAARLPFRKLERLGEAFPVLLRLKNGRMVILSGLTQDAPGPRAAVMDPLADQPGFILLDRAELSGPGPAG